MKQCERIPEKFVYMQYTGDNLKEAVEFVNEGDVAYAYNPKNSSFELKTGARVEKGFFLVQTSIGIDRVRVCSEEHFNQHFRPV